MDNYLRAFDIDTGAELWKGRLPAGGQATPMTYRLRPDGRQFVVIAAGGHGKLGTKLGDSLIAFALPYPAPLSSSVRDTEGVLPLSTPKTGKLYVHKDCSRGRDCCFHRGAAPFQSSVRPS